MQGNLEISGGSGGGDVSQAELDAATDAQFIVAAADADLPNERVATDTATVAWDFGTAAQAKANVPDDAITFDKIQNITSDRLLGRDTALSGSPEEIAVGGGIEFTGGPGIQTGAFTGDVTKAAGGTALTIANNAVTDAKLRDSAAVSVIGRAANSSGDPADIAAAANGQVLKRSGDVLAFAAADLAADVTGTLPVANGGTGRASHTAYAVLCGGTTTTAAQQSIAGVGTLGQVLKSNGASALPTFQTGGYTEETTTSTGTVNDFDLDARETYLRCNNASALILTGFTVLGATPIAGDTVIIDNVGTSTVKVAFQTGSTSANRIITSSTQGQIIGASGRMVGVYDDTTDRWRISVLDAGATIAVPYASGDFTGNGSMTWTVESADVTAFKYQQNGNLLTIALQISQSTVGGTPNTTLLVAIPGGFTAAATYGALVKVSDNAVDKVGQVNIGVGQNTMDFYNSLAFSGSNWAAATNTTEMRLVITMLIN